jgi:hypothetical protein
LYEDAYISFGVGIKRWKICCCRVAFARFDFSGSLDFKGSGPSADAARVTEEVRKHAQWRLGEQSGPANL